MPGIIDHASAILSASERRLQAAALNIANGTTPGFKRQVVLPGAYQACEGTAPCDAPGRRETVVQFDFRQGRLNETGEPLDLAIVGPALLQLRDGDELVYSRGGSFALREGGIVADMSGRVLQQAGGGDLTLSGNRIEILGDGTVLEDSLPRARIALLEAGDARALVAAGGANFLGNAAGMAEAENSSIRQGFLESSNVVTSDEMISLMASTREAESGGKLAQYYDQLMGQAIATFRNSR